MAIGDHSMIMIMKIYGVVFWKLYFKIIFLKKVFYVILRISTFVMGLRDSRRDKERWIEISERLLKTAWIDWGVETEFSGGGFMNAASVFITFEGFRHHPHRLRKAEIGRVDIRPQPKYGMFSIFPGADCQFFPGHFSFFPGALFNFSRGTQAMPSDL